MSIEDSAQAAMPELMSLARLLINKRNQTSPVVVPFVGAGASASAGLPNSSQLMHRIYNELVKNSRTDDPIRELFDREAETLFPKKGRAGILRLTFFEFAAVVSQFAYGREVTRSVLQLVLRQATRRPLAYELLAHLAKHNFVDHFVSLNFDVLLDEALQEEMPDELRIIAGSEDIPGRHAAHELPESTCYFVKPFGSLTVDKFRLRPDELNTYGQDSIWKFLLENIFRHQTGNRTPNIVLLLVGYAAAEQAFFELIGELNGDGERAITIYVVDPIEKLSPALESLGARHIRLGADLALLLLLELMRQEFADRGRADKRNGAKVWTPIARHRVVSDILSYRQLTNPSFRFKIELILQAVKSRGSFTIEALGEVERIKKYSSEAHHGIADLRGKGILEFQKWSDPAARARPTDYLAEDYVLVTPDYDELARKVLALLNSQPDESMDNWTVQQTDDGFAAVRQKTTRVKYLSEQFEQIASAPEIEVSPHGWPYARWLFSRPTLLTSVDELTESTTDIFTNFHRAGGGHIYGIWVTGEWLFHPEGWAYQIGNDVLSLMSEGRAELSMILVRIPVSDSVRRERAERARATLRSISAPGAYRIYEMDWWKHNRRLTLIRYQDETNPGVEGIYMRRRHATPLVTPVRVSGKDCNILERIFERYAAKAKLVEGSPSPAQAH